MALFGSGWQAGSHLPAMCAVRPLKRVNVFSPTKANREAFVKEMQPKVTAEVRAVDSPEEAIRDADIIAATTNSLTPRGQRRLGQAGIAFDLCARAGAGR